jgi:hypothetical protein
MSPAEFNDWRVMPVPLRKSRSKLTKVKSFAAAEKCDILGYFEAITSSPTLRRYLIARLQETVIRKMNRPLLSIAALMDASPS